jgi:hypothetical protein
MVSLISMPRTGSSLAKRYLGGFDRIKIADLQNFLASYSQSRSLSAGTILFDKKTANIRKLHQLIPRTAGDVALLCLVRDPRDQLISLSETDRHKPVPRDARFWPFWVHRYRRTLIALSRLGRLGYPVALVRYEDLVEAPTVVKAAFLSWLGFDSVDVDDAYEPVHDDGASRREDWKVHGQSRVSAASVGRWQQADTCSAGVVSALHAYKPALRLMRRLGYSAETPADAGATGGPECRFKPLDPRSFPHVTLLSRSHTSAPTDR